MHERMMHMASDKDDKPVFLADSAWTLQMAKDKNPEIEFHFISEF